MKMDEYIGRTALLEHLAQCKRSEDSTTLIAAVITALQCFIQNQPAADVVPVVRCKDCRWRGREECAMFYRCECGEQHTWEKDNDFCSYGERRDDGKRGNDTGD